MNAGREPEPPVAPRRTDKRPHQLSVSPKAYTEHTESTV